MFQYLNSLTTYMVFKNRKHNIKKTRNNGTFSILVPDMTGCRIFRVQVQQQEGVDDCGLFGFVYLELLRKTRF